MRRLGIIIGILALIGIGVLAWYAMQPDALAFAGDKTIQLKAYQEHASGVPAELASADVVARGRYLTDAADCQACHTVPGGTPFAGGRAFKTSFGTLYSPNITPDAATGIGSWSDAEFLRALHEGVNRDGDRLYPAFPYASYTYMADEDALAIKAYLFSLAPVKSTAPENSLSFPFNQRWLMSIWSALFNPGERFEPVPDRGAEWNRGAYLAEALGHCGDCHTPRNLLQAVNHRDKFAGAVAEGWHAYNITADRDSGIGGWSAEELTEYLSEGHAHGRGGASGPMGEVVELSLSRLSPADIKAMVTYVRSVPAISSKDLPAPNTSPASSDPKQLRVANADAMGKHVFQGACASCHNWTGVSPLSAHATLTGLRSVNDASAVNIAQMVLWGSHEGGEHRHGLSMPGFGAIYSDEEVAAVANYVTARFGAKASSISADEVRGLRASR
jgi:mono/diheme cytochrome c family protein